jgi:tetratricopeptide (TPR) repeat protein
MKKLLLTAAISFTLAAQAQIKMPQPSPSQSITQDFGLGKIELSYSRPSIKARSLFKDNSELAPLGKVWRTGANGATTLKFTDAVSINGVALTAGKYGLLSIPGKAEWTLIISKDTTVNQPANYKEANDLVRVKVPVMKMKESMELFTMQFANIQYESCELHLMWGNTAVSLPITTNIKDRIRAQVEQATGADKVTGNTYFTAANFYYEVDKDYNKALTNVSKAIDANPKAFYMYLLKAKIEKELGDKVAAKASAEKCVTLATEAQNDDYVRSAKNLIAKL